MVTIQGPMILFRFNLSYKGMFLVIYCISILVYLLDISLKTI